MAGSAIAARLTEAHRLAQAQIGADTVARMRTVWPLLDPTRLDATYERWLRAAVPLIQGQRSTSARLAANYLSTFKTLELGSGSRLLPVLSETAPVEAITTSLLTTGPGSIKRAMVRGIGLDRAAATAEAASAASAMRHAMNGGRETIAGSVAADHQAFGWARAASGKACAFCSMLASRGPVYSKDTADFEAHDGCSCSAEPVYDRGGDWPAGSRELHDLWIEAKSSDDPTSRFAELLNENRSAPARRAAVPQPAGRLTRSQYDAMLPDSSWSEEKRAAILDALASDDNGRILADTLDKFQDGGSIARLRTNIEKRLAGESLDKTSEARADAIIDALRHAPTENAPDKLFRGMSVKGTEKNLLAKYEVGGDLDLNITSFTTDRAKAVQFQKMTAGKGTTRVMVELVGDDKRLLPIQNLARDRRLFAEKEWVGGGKYEIVEVKKSPSGGLILRIRQKATL